ncbi:hypothetical protein [Anaeromyxobacter sp. K]|uniref:hypothetical protein n=1 Tax=Anaeromyxobacter sp. (strain K) TaxID=447217 RepID=UPI0012FAD21F|nr:hypothetical protein [Anaeromyxobacter sp. K]
MKNRLLAPVLFGYLVELVSLLRNAGEAAASEEVLHVSKFASGSTSEFYGEARLLLPEVLEKKGASLSENDRARLREVIEGIEREFKSIGGD